MSKAITKNYFETYMAEFRQGLKADFASKEDLKGLATKDDLKGFVTKDDIHRLEVKMATKEDVADIEGRLTGKFSQLQTSVDRYVKRTEGWYQELNVLKGKHDRLSDALIKKSVVTENDTTLGL